MLVARGLGKSFGARAVVDSIDLDVRRGECLGLLGPNGAGKTTTLAMLCGALPPSRGHVLVDGIDVAREPRVAKRRLGFVPQDVALHDELTAIENLRFAAALYDLRGAPLTDRIASLLEAVGLTPRARDRIKTYSGGMKRRLNLAAALLHEPAVLILDEPTVGVDAQSRYRIFSLLRDLKARGTAIVYATHYFEEVEALCDRVAVIDNGKLVAHAAVSELIDAHTTKRVTLTVTLDGEQMLAPIIAAIERAGASVVGAETRGANLEAAFLALTGHGLRDDLGPPEMDALAAPARPEVKS